MGHNYYKFTVDLIGGLTKRFITTDYHYDMDTECWIFWREPGPGKPLSSLKVIIPQDSIINIIVERAEAEDGTQH